MNFLGHVAHGRARTHVCVCVCVCVCVLRVVYYFRARCWEYFKELQIANSPRSGLRTRMLRVYVQLWMPCPLRTTL